MRFVRCAGLVLAAVLFAGGAVLCASAQDKPAGAAVAPAKAKTPDPETLSVQLLTRVSSADRDGLRQYLPIVKQQTKDQWLAALPPEVAPPTSAAGTVQIDASVHTDGRVTNLIFKQPSGDKALDRAARMAITGAAYDSFPYGLSVDQVRIRFTFVYNQGNAVPAAPASPHP